MNQFTSFQIPSLRALSLVFTLILFPLITTARENCISSDDSITPILDHSKLALDQKSGAKTQVFKEIVFAASASASKEADEAFVKILSKGSSVLPDLIRAVKLEGEFTKDEEAKRHFQSTAAALLKLLASGAPICTNGGCLNIDPISEKENDNVEKALDAAKNLNGFDFSLRIGAPLILRTFRLDENKSVNSEFIETLFKALEGKGSARATQAALTLEELATSLKSENIAEDIQTRIRQEIETQVSKKEKGFESVEVVLKRISEVYKKAR